MKLSHPSLALRFLTTAITALGVAGLISTTSAALLLDYTGGTVLASPSYGPSDKDDGFIPVSVGLFTSPFFGEAMSDPVNVSLNGHIYFGSGDEDGDYFTAPFGAVNNPRSQITRISPMWTDLLLGSTGQVLQNVGTGSSYTAVTWVNMQGGLGNNGFSATFQAIYFNAATTLNGISFNAGDIAFSYGDIINYDTPADIMIGLDQGVGGFATLPGYEAQEGWAASYEDGMPFPVGANQYVLYRPNGSNYDVTLQAIPEPSATAAALLGSVLFLARRRR